MPNKFSPIGLFDSGIGGLTVANAVAYLLPREQLLYFGDTARQNDNHEQKSLLSDGDVG